MIQANGLGDGIQGKYPFPSRGAASNIERTVDHLIPRRISLERHWHAGEAREGCRQGVVLLVVAQPRYELQQDGDSLDSQRLGLEAKWESFSAQIQSKSLRCPIIRLVEEAVPLLGEFPSRAKEAEAGAELNDAGARRRWL